MKEDFEKGILERALLHLKRNSVRNKDDGKYELYPLCVENEEIGKYGIGVFLYLNFLKKMAIGFLLMSFICIIPVVINILAGGL